jgi:hypothetical protein
MTEDMDIAGKEVCLLPVMLYSHPEEAGTGTSNRSGWFSLLDFLCQGGVRRLDQQ